MYITCEEACASPTSMHFSFTSWFISPERTTFQRHLPYAASKSFFSAMCVVSISILLIQALKWLYSWLSSVQFILGPFNRMSNAILKPLWMKIYLHLFTSYQAESTETAISQSDVYQAYAWRQGWPFLLKTLTEPNNQWTSGDVEELWGIAFQGGWVLFLTPCCSFHLQNENPAVL